ncbi:hypothetical protein, partial [Paucilactobacillus suebicus]|uniref:hypothetical protein n=1 Tax=Paucilactobacillus suebicus TaxID=152335 RepID=UPI00024905E7
APMVPTNVFLTADLITITPVVCFYIIYNLIDVIFITGAIVSLSDFKKIAQKLQLITNITYIFHIFFKIASLWDYQS